MTHAEYGDTPGSRARPVRQQVLPLVKHSRAIGDPRPLLKQAVMLKSDRLAFRHEDGYCASTDLLNPGKFCMEAVMSGCASAASAAISSSNEAA